MNKIAIFDFDETLVEENSLSYLFKFLLDNKPLFIYLFPILLNYRFYLGQVRPLIKQRLYMKALNKKSPTKIYQAGRYTARKLTQIEKVVSRLNELNDQGVEIWIITASPQSFIQGIVDELQWPVKRIVGTLLESDRGRLTGVIGDECQVNEKVHRFNKIVARESLQITVQEAYGNLPVDIPMLGLAEKQFYVEHGKISPFLGHQS